MKQIIYFLTAFLALPAGSVAQDGNSEVVFYNEVRGWQVFADRTVGNSCFGFNIYEDGTVLRLGFNAPGDANVVYLAIGNEKWASIEAEKDYDITIRMDRESPWDARARGLRMGDFPMLVIHTNEVGFFDEIVRKHGMSVYFNGNEIASLSLAGSAAASNLIVECQQLVQQYMASGALDDLPEPPSDPFATQQVDRRDDPFAF